MGWVQREEKTTIREDSLENRIFQDTPWKMQCAKKERAFSGRRNQAVETDKGTKSKKTLCAIIWDLIL